jgi:hypothetical protein
MSRGQKYRKIVFANTDRVTTKNSLVGMQCISDFRDTATTRTLVFEKQEKTATVEAPKPTTRKKKAAAGADDSPSKSLAFPGESAPSA